MVSSAKSRIPSRIARYFHDPEKAGVFSVKENLEQSRRIEAMRAELDGKMTSVRIEGYRKPYYPEPPRRHVWLRFRYHVGIWMVMRGQRMLRWMK